MANQKSTTLIALGVAVFVVGGALLFLVVRHNDHKSPKTPASSSAASAVTSTTLAPGTRVFPATTPTTVISFKIPPGENALAVQMAYFAGGGGYVQDGDAVNVFAVTKGACTDPHAPQGVTLIDSNVKVLSVLGNPPSSAGQPTSFLLAVTPTVAAQLIYQQTFNALYFTLTSANEAPASPLAVSCTNNL